jgi:hypothetical protein
MFDFSKIDPTIILNSNYILSKIDETAIWCNYYGSFKFNKGYSSKFRKDRRPSTEFRLNNHGSIRLVDYATGQRFDCFQYVKELYNCDYNQSLQIIARDFGLISNIKCSVPDQVFQESKNINLETKKQTLIQFISDKWNTQNLAYWKKYHIAQEELEKELIFPVKQLFVNKNEILGKQQRYAYLIDYILEGELKQGIKILSPYDEKMKWISSVTLSCMGDILNLPHNDNKIFICKSKKDKIILKKLFTDVCWTQNESFESFPLDIQDKLLNEYKERIIVYGSDTQGVEASKRFTERGFSWFNIPQEELILGVNDPAEYIKLYGIDNLKQLFINKNLL